MATFLDTLNNVLGIESPPPRRGMTLEEAQRMGIFEVIPTAPMTGTMLQASEASRDQYQVDAALWREALNALDPELRAQLEAADRELSETELELAETNQLLEAHREQMPRSPKQVQAWADREGDLERQISAMQRLAELKRSAFESIAEQARAAMVRYLDQEGKAMQAEQPRVQAEYERVRAEARRVLNESRMRNDAFCRLYKKAHEGGPDLFRQGGA